MERPGDSGGAAAPARASPPPRSPRGPTLVTSLSIREGEAGVEAKAATPPPAAPRSRHRSRSGGAVTSVALLEAAAVARPPPPPPEEDQELVLLKDLDTGKELRVEKVRIVWKRGGGGNASSRRARRSLVLNPPRARATARAPLLSLLIPAPPRPCSPHPPHSATPSGT